ncbi:MAG TPA: STAS/SEC14 domain-containing protein, partial [Candidatus Saccharimonadales bacterium]|nr:STAS/SEC14 domain-containing protein [Candidatus Saccharimonadales bacterium]
VYINPNQIIEVHVVGDQTQASVAAMGNEIEALITQVKSEGKRALILDNLTQMGSVEQAARNAVVDLAKKLPYDKLAMVGKGGGLLRLGANLILRATGKGGRVHYFDDMSKAQQWLAS